MRQVPSCLKFVVMQFSGSADPEQKSRDQQLRAVIVALPPTASHVIIGTSHVTPDDPSTFNTSIMRPTWTVGRHLQP